MDKNWLAQLSIEPTTDAAGFIPWKRSDLHDAVCSDKKSEVYTNRSTGVDSGRSVNVSAGAGSAVISFQLLQEQDPE